MTFKEQKENFKLSYSSLTDWENPNGCISSWWEKWVTKVNRGDPTTFMLRGQYFEAEMLRPYDGNDTHIELEDKPTSVVFKRINEKIKYGINMLDPKHEDFQGVYFRESQVYLENDKFKGVIDILGEDKAGRPCIVDQKLTADATSNFGFINWADDDVSCDQLLIYRELIADCLGLYNPRLMFFVFDYSNKDNKPLVLEFDIEDNSRDQRRLDDRVKLFYDEFSSLSEKDILNTNSSKDVCSRCILDCPFRYNSAKPEKKVLFR